MNEEDLAHWGPLRQKKKKQINKQTNKQVHLHTCWSPIKWLFYSVHP
jgi:hypothetical protein